MTTWQPPGWATAPARSTVALEVRDKSSNAVVKTHSLAQKAAFTMGRQMGAVDIHVPDEVVSRVHAAVVHKGDQLFIIDLKSAAGVTVDGREKIKPNEAKELREGMRFALGDSKLRYYVTGLAPAATLAAPPAASMAAPTAAPPQKPPAAAAVPPAGWEAPAWAELPSAPVAMHLEEGGQKVQSLDLSRHASYVLGRSKEHAKLVVPHESVSRQHAAIVHASHGPGGAPSVHVIDLASAKGTFLDLGGGWTRLAPNTPTVLPPGARVRLGDCPTRIVYPKVDPAAGPEGAAAAAPVGPSIGPAIGPAGPPVGLRAGGGAEAADVDDPTPRFSSLLSSRLVGEGGGAAGADGGEEKADDEGGGGTALDEDEEAERAKAKSNVDFRNSLLPFLAKAADVAKPAKQDEKKAKKRRKGDDSDSDGEPPPPLTLGKGDGDEPASNPGGLMLRKQKAAPAASGGSKKSKGKAKSGPKIVF